MSVTLPRKQALQAREFLAETPIAIPTDDETHSEGKVGPMFGGCFIYASDPRFYELLREMGYEHVEAVRLHDRFESRPIGVQ